IPSWRPHPVDSAERNLDAVLYVQTAAEYEACCLQAYNVGAERLKARLAVPQGDDTRPPAIIMDLDETVLDNSPFEGYLLQHGLTFSDELWNVWERDHADDVRLVPGAKSFIDLAEEQKVSVVYISNRLTKYAASTEAALRHLGIGGDNLSERLLLRDGPSG